MHGAAGSMHECTRHSQIMETDMQVYVGTYAKYNNGDLTGDWLKLEDYADEEEFLKACKVIHNDEADPEFMFQDHVGVPDSMISEPHIDEAVWEVIEAFEEHDEYAVRAYIECFGQWDADGFRDNYRGEFASWREMAEELLDETGQLDDCPPLLTSYFDYDRYAHDLRLSGDFVEHDGHFFWNS